MLPYTYGGKNSNTWTITRVSYQVLRDAALYEMTTTLRYHGFKNAAASIFCRLLPATALAPLSLKSLHTPKGFIHASCFPCAIHNQHLTCAAWKRRPRDIQASAYHQQAVSFTANKRCLERQCVIRHIRTESSRTTHKSVDKACKEPNLQIIRKKTVFFKTWRKRNPRKNKKNNRIFFFNTSTDNNYIARSNPNDNIWRADVWIEKKYSACNTIFWETAEIR